MIFRKKDIILLASLIIIAFIGFFILNSNIKSGSKVVITADGEEYGTYLLSEDKEIKIENEFGKNTVVIKDGFVFMKDADCRDGVCVSHPRICESGNPIVCLPHKLIVEVKE